MWPQHGRRFILRPEVLEFGSAYLAAMNIEEVAAPSLQAVRDETGDSSSLAVLSGHDVLYLVHVSTSRRLRVEAAVGTRFPPTPPPWAGRSWPIVRMRTSSASCRQAPLRG